jgi:hypothetical protein
MAYSSILQHDTSFMSSLCASGSKPDRFLGELSLRIVDSKVRDGFLAGAFVSSVRVFSGFFFSFVMLDKKHVRTDGQGSGYF